MDFGIVSENTAGHRLLCLLMQDDAFCRLVLDSETACEAVPEARAMIGFDQRNPHHPYDAWVHTAHAVAYAAKTPILRLALLMHDLGKPPTFYMTEDEVGHFNRHEKRSEKIARERLPLLGFDAETVETAALLVRHHDKKIAEADVAHWVAELGAERFALLLDVKEADARAHSDKYKKIQLAKLAQLRAKANRL